MHLPGFTLPPVPAHTEVTWLRVVSQTLGRSRFNYSLATSSVTTYEPNLLLRPLGLGALGLTLQERRPHAPAFRGPSRGVLAFLPTASHRVT